MSNYPLQCFAAKREKQTLSVDTFLSVSNDSKTNPLEIPGYSRFKITLVDKKGEKIKCPFANIPESDIALINRITDIALQIMVESKCNGGEQGATTTTSVGARFKFGQNIGKTPLEVLQQNPKDGEARLATEREFAQNNLVKFPKNQELIDAIDDAIRIFSSGAEVKADAHKSSYIPIYEIEYKSLESQKDSEGRCKIYSILMAYDSTKNYPFTVRIANAFAHVKETPTGGKKVDFSTSVNKEESTISLTESEFVQMVSRMQEFHEAFLTINFKPQYSKANCANCYKIRTSTNGNKEADFCCIKNCMISRKTQCPKELEKRSIKLENTFEKFDEELRNAIYEYGRDRIDLFVDYNTSDEQVVYGMYCSRSNSFGVTETYPSDIFGDRNIREYADSLDIGFSEA